VIGNSAYTAISPLANPKNDAELMAATLREVGFEVVPAIDVDVVAMGQAVRDFGKALRSAGKDAVGLFYYAGHGVQTGRGHNYLLPIGADIDIEADLGTAAISASDVLAQMEGAGNALNLVILDACRNNPFEGKFRSGGRGLARIQAASGSMIAFAAAPGQVAADGGGANSPYTAALAVAMKEPGLAVEQVFKRVRVSVESRTGGAQTPWEESSLRGDFYFVPGIPAFSGGPTLSAPTDNEALYWSSIKDSGNLVAFEAYLKQFPSGIFADLARIRIAELKQQLAVGIFPQQPELTSTRGYAPGDEFKDCDACPVMVVLPAGTFTMGSPENEEGRSSNEGPLHDVTISTPFAVGKFEVTRGQFAAFVDATQHNASTTCAIWTGSKWKRTYRSRWKTQDSTWRDPGYAQTDDHPISCVSWDDAAAYVVWLARKTGESYRLLSESEWEYAARGQTKPGSYPRFHFGNATSDLCDYANGADRSTPYKWTNRTCSDGVGAATASVGEFRPNAFRLHDMLGNVSEWIEDCGAFSYKRTPWDGSAADESHCYHRGARGGNWISGPEGLRSAHRYNAGFNERKSYSSFGFRVARTLAQ